MHEKAETEIQPIPAELWSRLLFCICDKGHYFALLPIYSLPALAEDIILHKLQITERQSVLLKRHRPKGTETPEITLKITATKLIGRCETYKCKLWTSSLV